MGCDGGVRSVANRGGPCHCIYAVYMLNMRLCMCYCCGRLLLGFVMVAAAEE